MLLYLDRVCLLAVEKHDNVVSTLSTATRRVWLDEAQIDPGCETQKVPPGL